MKGTKGIKKLKRSGKTSPPEKEVGETSLRGLVEAVLFATGKPLSPNDIAVLLGEDPASVRKSLKILVERYAGEPEGALEIGTEGGYILQVKPIYARATLKLVPMELSQSALRTLSAIALKQPVLQSELVDLCGSSAYDHVKDLLEKELILKEPEGRSYRLKTSPRFEDYFQVDKNILKSSLDRFKRVEKPEKD